MRDLTFLKAEYPGLEEQELLLTMYALGTHLHKVTLALMYHAMYSRYFAYVLREFLLLNSEFGF